MERKAAILCALFCCLMLAWPLWDLKQPVLEMRDLYPSLYERAANGTQLYPRDTLDYSNLMNASAEFRATNSPTEALYNMIFHDNIVNPMRTELEYSIPGQLELSSLPVANRSKCTEQLRWTLGRTLELQERNFRFEPGEENHQLAKYLSSFGKPESDFYKGSIWWIGSYDSCLESQLKQGEQQVKMRYCWSRWRFVQWKREQHKRMFPKVDIRVGACIPESCDSRVIEDDNATLAKLISLDWPSVYKDNLKLETMFCLPDERSPIRKLPNGGRIYLALIAAWLLLLAAAHVWRAHWRKRFCEKEEAEVLKLVSVHKAHKKLMSISEFQVNYKHIEPDQWPRVDLRFLNALKFMLHISIVFVHTLYVTMMHHSTMDWIYAHALNGYSGALIVSLASGLDLFFIISGLFSGFNITHFVEGNQPLWRIWIEYNVRVLCRTLPIFLLAHYFARFLAAFLSAGPFWDYGTSELTRRGTCMNPIWYEWNPYNTIIHKVGSVPCIPQTWFLRVYFQACLFVPLLVWLLCKLPNEKSRLALVVFTQTMSISLYAERLLRQTTVKPETFVLQPAINANVLNTIGGFAGYKTFEHIGVILSGCYIGYLLQKYKGGFIERWPRWLQSTGTLVAMVVCVPALYFWPVLGRFAYEQTRELPGWGQVIGGFIFWKFAWVAMGCLTLLTLSTVYKSTRFVRFLSHPFWLVSNRLGLCIFLAHFEILEFIYSWHDGAPNPGSCLRVLEVFSLALILCIALAIPVYFLFQVPMNAILLAAYQKTASIFTTTMTRKAKNCEEKTAAFPRPR